LIFKNQAQTSLKGCKIGLNHSSKIGFYEGFRYIKVNDDFQSKKNDFSVVSNFYLPIFMLLSASIES
jgi:hypothetical protein